jgi:TldD protein
MAEIRAEMSMARAAVEAARAAGADYADARVTRKRTQLFRVRNGETESVQDKDDFGLGVRVLFGGAWGFAARAISGEGEAAEPSAATPARGLGVEAVALEAVQVARASAMVPSSEAALPGSSLGDEQSGSGLWRSKFEINPFEVPVRKKIEVLLEADEAMRRVGKVKVAVATMNFMWERKLFASSEGSEIEQERIESGAGAEAVALSDGEMQTRSYPNNFGQHLLGGYEVITGMNLASGAEKAAREAVELLDAPPCPSTETTVILDSSQMVLQIHESCGHPTELDRVFGTEASYAGTSFLTPDKLGSFRYGSRLVNLAADATVEGGVGSFGYDDEGVPAQREYLVKEGVFSGYLMSRETALRLARLLSGGLRRKSNGCMRAESWNRLPIIRMTNINLEPGDCTLEDMIADTKQGIYMETNRSWSIDDVRLNFQFGCELAREIENGKLGRLLKNPTYQGVTPEFWKSCDAVGNASEWRLWGLPNCGKGEPVQSAHVGHGSAPARFRNVRVGIVS